jgi:hypothetical protein
MATTGVNFVEIVSAANAILSGSAVVATPFVAGLTPDAALNCVNATPSNTAITAENAVPLDRIIFDLALKTVPPAVGTTFVVLGKYVGGFAKNGCALVNLTGTTAVTVDLTNLAAFTGVTSQAGDTSLATVNCLIFNNLGAVAVTVAPGGSNPSRLPTFTGTTPTLSIPAGGAVCVFDSTGQTVDSTHKTFTLTPTAGGSIAFGYGGA